MGEITSFEDFQTKIKAQLNESEEDHASRFNQFNQFLSQFGTIESLINGNQGVKILINDFYTSICEAVTDEVKEDRFKEMIQELTAHLAKKPPIRIPESECVRRKKRMDKIRREMIRLEAKIKRLSKRELSLDELDDDENNVLLRIERYEKRVVKLYEELRKLENKHLYFGDDEIEFGDLTKNETLNALLRREILTKFNKLKCEPDYNEIVEIVDKFCRENDEHFDAKIIFQNVCAKFREYNNNKLEFTFNAYLNDSVDEPTPIETDELREKLDSQNTFRQKLDDVVSSFIEKAKYEQANETNEEDEESEDSESDSINEDTIETVSEDEDEFISQVVDEENDENHDLIDSIENGNSDQPGASSLTFESENEQAESTNVKSRLEEMNIEAKSDESDGQDKRKLQPTEDQSSKKIKTIDEGCIILD